MLRKASNGITAFAICGLWHGAAWNFLFWGLYHGVGLLIFTRIKFLMQYFRLFAQGGVTTIATGWVLTYLYVCIGWLYFFYPVNEATSMFLLLFK
jgi:alginate O-acetyltransferase complex protein AlgI